MNRNGSTHNCTLLGNNCGLNYGCSRDLAYGGSCFSWAHAKILYSCTVSGVLKKTTQNRQHRQRNLVLAVAMTQPYQITSAPCGRLLDPNLLQTGLAERDITARHFVCGKTELICCIVNF